MIRILPILIFICFGSLAYAQFSETIRTGRPCQSIGAFTVGKGVLQIQQGIDYSGADSYISQDDSDPYLEGNDLYFNNVIRFGITRKFEISAVMDYHWYEQQILAVGDDKALYSRDNSFGALDLGGRYNILEAKNGGPAWCIQARLGFVKYTQADLFNKSVDLKIKTSMVQRLNRYQSVTVNLGTNTFKNTQYTLNYSLSITPEIGWVVENYGGYDFDRELFTTYFDTGISYLLNNNIQLDVQGGFGNNKAYFLGEKIHERSFFIGAGISWRVVNHG